MAEKLYIMELESLEGDETIIFLEANGQAVRNLYCIVLVGNDGAHIVDNGYRTMKEAQDAWPTAKPCESPTISGLKSRQKLSAPSVPQL